MRKQHSTPCRECPWRVNSPKGWLGAATPVEFVQTSEAEHRMPCHLHVDYDQADWQQQANQAPQCAGRAIHFANRCKQPQEPDLLRLPADRESVFVNPQAFIEHHTPGDEPAPRILIMGRMVRVIS
jgi:hypothetical protein